MTIISPMLAVAVTDIDKIKYPAMVTPKLDGIRCLIIDGRPVSRKFKPIPNVSVNKLLEGLPSGLDGELMIEGVTFNQIQSAIMSKEGEVNFQYHVFDYVVDTNIPYIDRIQMLRDLELPNYCKKLLPTFVYESDELLALEFYYLNDGSEGLMIRSCDGPYKCGRSTLKEGYLLKLKRFEDAEATVIGFKERMQNCNPKEKDALIESKASHNITIGALGSQIIVNMDLVSELRKLESQLRL